MVAIQVRDGIAFIKLNGVPGNAVFGHKITKDSGMLNGDVLEYQKFHQLTRFYVLVWRKIQAVFI